MTVEESRARTLEAIGVEADTTNMTAFTIGILYLRLSRIRNILRAQADEEAKIREGKG